MYQPKVTNTQKYSDDQSECIVCKAKLLLIKVDEKVNIGDLYKYPHGAITLCKWGDVGSANRSPLRRKLKPIIISETEEIEVGDKAYFAGEIIVWSQADEDGYNKFVKKPPKVLALPEQFSDKHLQAIVDRKMKEGEVLIKCEVFEEPTHDGDADKYTTKQIHLDQQNYITLFPAKQSLEEVVKKVKEKYDHEKYYDEDYNHVPSEQFKEGVEWAKKNNYKGE